MILLDFSKAFDKVPHQRLLMKLDYYGVRGQTLKWIQNFLMHRTQQVVVEGEKSSTGDVISGVPQGSVLGPTLFLIYINDITTNIKATVRLFADDTALYQKIHQQSDATSLQKDLDTLQDWEEQWQMGFNVSKCHVLSVTNKKNPIKSSYFLHQQPLEKVNSAKYLGVEITSDLHWGKHINSISSKANQTSAFIYRNLRGCPDSVQAHCYKSLARPVLEYASPVWDPHQSTLINSLEAVQRRAARRIVGDFSPSSSATVITSKLNLPSLQERRLQAKNMMMYKIVNGLVDMSPPAGILTTRDERLRGHGFKTLHSRVDAFRHSFFPSAIRAWNELPVELTSAKNPDLFKKHVENWTKSHR